MSHYGTSQYQVIYSIFEFFTKLTFWVSTIFYRFGLVVSGKKALILSSHYKTFQTYTTQPQMGVSLIYIGFLTLHWVLSMQRFVFPVLLDLFKSLCFGCFLTISCLLCRGVCVIFFILAYVQFLFKLLPLFTYRVSFCFVMCKNQLQHPICCCCKVCVDQQLMFCSSIRVVSFPFLFFSGNMKSVNISFWMVHSITC